MSHSTEAKWLLDEKYGGVESPAFFDDLRALETGTPLAYLIGHVPFLGATIHLDSHPLIPRTETEYWVGQAIKDLQRSKEGVPTRFLDLCAGSGAIGVALLKAFPGSHVDFAEIDIGHHDTIKRNIRENGIDESRTRVFGGNLFEKVTGTYDAILSNPPYINPELSDRVAQSVLINEPHQALFGGKDGMELIERIVREAPNHLNAGGTLYIEHEPEQTPRLAEFGTLLGFTTNTLKDQYGHERVTRYEFRR